MDYSEFHHPSKLRQDSGQSRAENNFVELPWGNGQVVAHDQSIRNRSSIAASINFSSDAERLPKKYVEKVSEKDNKDVGMPKTVRLEAMDSFLNEFCLPVASYNVEEIAQDGNGDMVPRINYPVEDSVPGEYYSELLCDVPAANLPILSVHGTSVPIHTNTVVGECFRGPLNVEHGGTYGISSDASYPSGTKISHFNELSQHSVPSGIKPKAEDVYTGDGINRQKGTSGGFQGKKSQKQDPPSAEPVQSSSVGLMNFSHFSRPTALAIANLRNVSKLKNIENTTIATGSKAPDPIVVQYSAKANLHCWSPEQLNPVLTKIDDESPCKSSKDVACFEHAKANFQEHKASNVTRRNSDSENCISVHHNSASGSYFKAGLSLARSETKKGLEAIVTSSSFCSGISSGAVSDELKQRGKRKVQATEESDSRTHNDEFEDELVGQAKFATTSKVPSTKRSRAAELHNLSERRRRDRINEKMRTLQELIPNCSKVDKTSMLDDLDSRSRVASE